MDFSTLIAGPASAGSSPLQAPGAGIMAEPRTGPAPGAGGEGPKIDFASLVGLALGRSEVFEPAGIMAGETCAKPSDGRATLSADAKDDADGDDALSVLDAPIDPMTLSVLLALSTPLVQPLAVVEPTVTAPAADAGLTAPIADAAATPASVIAPVVASASAPTAAASTAAASTAAAGPDTFASIVDAQTETTAEARTPVVGAAVAPEAPATAASTAAAIAAPPASRATDTATIHSAGTATAPAAAAGSAATQPVQTPGAATPTAPPPATTPTARPSSRTPATAARAALTAAMQGAPASANGGDVAAQAIEAGAVPVAAAGVATPGAPAATAAQAQQAPTASGVERGASAAHGASAAAIPPAFRATQDASTDASGSQGGDARQAQPGAIRMLQTAAEPADAAPALSSASSTARTHDALPLASLAGLTTEPVLRPIELAATSRFESAFAALDPDAQNMQAMVRTVRLFAGADGVSEARLSLAPDHLGPVGLTVRVEQGSVSAHFRAETPAAQRWIETHQQELRAGLREQGLEVKDVVVTTDPDGRRDRRQEPPTRQPRPRRTNDADPNAPRFEVLV